MNTGSNTLNLPNLNLGNAATNTRRSMNRFTNQFQGLTSFMKFLVSAIGLFAIIFIVYLLYVLIRDFSESLSNEPFLVKGTKLGQSPLKISGSKAPPSVDGKFGVEFSYSMWLYIRDYTYREDKWKHILHKGNHTAMPLQAPGIWLYPKENKMAINMNTFHSVKESCDIGNLPINKWFHLTVVVIGKFIDVYINGRLKKRCQFKGVPKQNYGDIWINQWQGFDGFLSNVRYFNSALPIYRIEELVKNGPSTGTCIDDGKTLPPYLAPDWWQTSGFSDVREDK